MPVWGGVAIEDALWFSTERGRSRKARNLRGGAGAAWWHTEGPDVVVVNGVGAEGRGELGRGWRERA